MHKRPTEFALLLLVPFAGCQDFVVLQPLPPQGIASIDCTCTLDVDQQIGTCAFLGCQCGAFAAGACIEDPRDDDACRAEISDAIDNCEVFPGVTLDPPDEVNLVAIEETCDRFVADGCTLEFGGSFCTGQDATDVENRESCLDICGAAGAFLDFRFSSGSALYDCGNPVDVLTAEVTPGRAEECGLECPAVPCNSENLDDCTVIQNPVVAGVCASGFTSAPFCRKPDEDPPVLEAGGLIAETLTRRSLGRVQNSALTLHLADGNKVIPLGGTVDILGEPCDRCPMSMRASIHGDDTSVGDASVTELYIAAGTGTTPVVELDEAGNGVVSPGLLSGTVSMSVDGERGFVTTRSLSSFAVHLDREARTFSFVGSLVITGEGDTSIEGSLSLEGTLENQPPTVDVAADQVHECSAHGGSVINLRGSVTDRDGFADLRAFAWYEGAPFAGEGGGTFIAPWMDATVHAPLGETTYALTAFDRHMQEHSDALEIEVRDTTPPSADVSYDGPPCFWAPNHSRVVLRVDRDFRAVVTDACDAAPVFEILSATSDQPDDGTGDGSTVDDVVVFPDRVCLRAERAGNDRSGRTYTVLVHAVDASGNESTPEVQVVVVPHDQSPDNRCQRLDVEVVDDDAPECMPLAGGSEAAPATPPAALPAQPADEHAPHEAMSCASVSSGFGLGLALVFLLKRRRRAFDVRSVATVATASTFALLPSGCPAPYEFRWEDTRGNICDATCADASCATDLSCNAAPVAECVPPAGEEDLPWHPCWSVAVIDDLPEGQAIGVPDLLGLCTQCCTTPDGPTLIFDREELCAPLICDPEGQAPPAPAVCEPTTGRGLIQGYVRQPARDA